MSLLIGIILAIIVFFIVVFIHEMGHFLVARWSGVKVHEFGIGIPPRLRRLFTDKHGTAWTLNWLPLGGFVRLKGEDFFSSESRDADALPSAPWWKQVCILLAGVMMNFLLAGCLFALLFYRGTEPLMIQIREFAPNALLSHISQGTQLIPIFDTLDQAEKSGVLHRSPGVILNPLADSLASQAGIMRGDIAVTLDGKPLMHPEELIRALSIQNGKHTLGIIRNETTLDITITPKNGKIGTYIAPNIQPVHYQY